MNSMISTKVTHNAPNNASIVVPTSNASVAFSELSHELSDTELVEVAGGILQVKHNAGLARV
jgi:hypothetical protein